MSQDDLQVSELATGGEEADEEVKIGPLDGSPRQPSKATEVSQGQTTETEGDGMMAGGAQPQHIASTGGTASAEGSSSNPNPRAAAADEVEQKRDRSRSRDSSVAQS